MARPFLIHPSPGAERRPLPQPARAGTAVFRYQNPKPPHVTKKIASPLKFPPTSFDNLLSDWILPQTSCGIGRFYNDVTGEVCVINQVISGVMFRNAPQAYSGASARATMTQKMSQVADKVDKNNTGNVTREQFTAAFQSMPMPIKIKAMGANALFDKVDPEKKGSLSKQDFATRMKDVILQARSQGAPQSNTSSNANSSASSNASSATAKTQNPSDSLTSSTRSLEATAGRQAAASSSSDQRTGSNVNVYA